MKKIYLIGLMIVFGLSVGCTPKKAVTIDIDQLAERLYTEITYKDMMDDDFDANVVEMYYGLSESDYVKFHIFLSTLATAEEIAVFEAKDEQSAELIFEAMKTRIDNQKVDYESYVPEELVKLDDAVIDRNGKYVVLSVSDESEKAIKIIEEYFK